MRHGILLHSLFLSTSHFAKYLTSILGSSPTATLPRGPASRCSGRNWSRRAGGDRVSCDTRPAGGAGIPARDRRSGHALNRVRCPTHGPPSPTEDTLHGLGRHLTQPWHFFVIDLLPSPHHCPAGWPCFAVCPHRGTWLGLQAVSHSEGAA